MKEYNVEKPIRVLYLFNGSRDGLLDKVRRGENAGDGFWGMTRLSHYGIEADYLELEQFFPKKVCGFLRKHIPMYFIHLPLFWKMFSYDIVFTSSAFGSQFLHALLSRLGLKRPLWIMHDFSITGMIRERQSLKQKVFYWMTRNAAGIVTLSEAEKDRLVKMFPHLRGRIEFITFGVDPDFFTPGAAEKGKEIFAAGFDPDRDWRTLIKACEGLGTPLVIATRSERLKKLEPLPAFVKVRSFTHRELAAQYANSAVVALPLNTSSGVNDAMGCSTLFEAMACGCAIVASRTPTIASYITHGKNGLLVPEGDVEVMRDSIQQILNNHLLREKLGQNARTYAVANLNSEELAGRLANFFRRILKRE